MEPDAQGYAQGDVSPAAETPQNGSEAGKTPEATAENGIKAEMIRERQARQALEAQLNNPEFIYNQAKSLGMTNEEAQAAAESAPEAPKEPAKAQVKPQELTWEVIEKRLAERQSLEKMAADDNAAQLKENPQLQTDPVLNDLYLKYAQTMRFSDAAAKVLELENKRLSTKTPEEVEAERVRVQADKASATTGRTGTLTSAEATDIEALKKQAQNRGNVSAQKNALFEMLRSGKL